MKEFLLKLIADKKAKMEELSKRSADSKDVNELRSINSEMDALKAEISDVESQLANLEKEEEERKAKEVKPTLNPIATFEVKSAPKAEEKEPEEKRATMEYRKAFMNYYQRGEKSDILEYRENSRATSGDLGVLLPITIIQDIIKDIEKVWGVIYARVRKTNVKGGVKYPIGSFGATFHRIAENAAPTDRQKGGTITGYVYFTYKMGEVRIARSFMESVLTVPVFEQELARTIAESYLKAMDSEILNGVGDNNELEGIITELNKASGSRILSDNVIEFSANDLKDWKKWQKLLFAKIPLSMRNLKPEFLMTANTYESNIKTLHDDNNRPVYNETFNPVDGAEKATFKGKDVLFCEEGLGIENFDDADAGEVFGLFWVPDRAYAINTNYEFAVDSYFDHEKKEYVDSATVINDGKILDPKYLYILKKKA